MIKTTNTYNFQICNPKLAREWHMSKNGGLVPSEVTPFSGKKVWWQCEKGHEWEATVNNRSNKKGCPYCVGNARLTIDFIRSEFEKEGYTLKTTAYENAHQKLDYICPNEHKHSIIWGAWQQGIRCSHCAGNVRKTIDFIKLDFEKSGYILTTIEYNGAHSKLNYICPNKHRGSVAWNNWKLGKRCPICNGINQSVRQVGPDNPNWKGGISFEPYCPIWKDKDFKEFIKQRDGCKCMNPCCSSEDPDDLCVHHFAYDKKACSHEDLITLCRSCNSRANKNREWHTAWYQAIMYMRYGYVYNYKGGMKNGLERIT